MFFIEQAPGICSAISQKLNASLFFPTFCACTSSELCLQIEDYFRLSHATSGIGICQHILAFTLCCASPHFSKMQNWLSLGVDFMQQCNFCRRWNEIWWMIMFLLSVDDKFSFTKVVIHFDSLYFLLFISVENVYTTLHCYSPFTEYLASYLTGNHK